MKDTYTDKSLNSIILENRPKKGNREFKSKRFSVDKVY